jgi:hypothetical protein
MARVAAIREVIRMAMIMVQTRPSPRAEALSNALAETIAEFRRSQTDVSVHEIQQALQLALRKTIAANPVHPTVSAVVVLAVSGVLALIGVTQAIGRQNDIRVWIPLGMAAILAAFFLIRFGRR